MMKVSVESIPSCRVALIRRIGPYGADNKQIMERLKEWAVENHYMNDQTVILGIARDNPAATRPENCRYDVCVVLPDGGVAAGGEVREETLPGGTYAVFQIPHTPEAVQQAFSEVLPALQGRGLRPDAERPVIERYQAQMVSRHLCEICVPIQDR